MGSQENRGMAHVSVVEGYVTVALTDGDGTATVYEVSEKRTSVG